MKIKEKLYSQLNTLGLEVLDNPYMRKAQSKFPFLLFRTMNLMTKERNGLIETNYIFLIDIYSDYSGEKEIYEIYNKILTAVKPLLQEQSVARVQDNGIKIIDDLTLGKMLKHGIMTINIKTTELKGVE